MISNYAGIAVGLGGGIVCGLSLRGAVAMVAVGAKALATSLGLVFAMVFLICDSAWTWFTEYVGKDGWWWLAAGVLAGAFLGEMAFRWGRRLRVETEGSAVVRASRFPMSMYLIFPQGSASALGGQKESGAAGPNGPAA